MKASMKLTLAALLAVTAMALLSTSSAMAESTAFCKVDQDPCSEGNQVTHLHETSVGKGKLLAEGLPTVECTVLFLGDTFRWWVEIKGIIFGESVGLEGFSQQIVGRFTYSSCNNFCSVKGENGPAVIYVQKTASELASVTGEGLVHVNCPFINCSYNGTGLEGHGLGALTSTSANGNVTLTKQLTQKETGSALCPEEAFLDLTTTPFEKTYISS